MKKIHLLFEKYRKRLRVLLRKKYDEKKNILKTNSEKLIINIMRSHIINIKKIIRISKKVVSFSMIFAFIFSGILGGFLDVKKAEASTTPVVGFFSPEALLTAAANVNLNIRQPDPRNGDLMIATIAIRPAASTVNTPSGWTLLDSRTGTDGGAEGADTGSVGTYVFYKVADGTEGTADQTFTENGTTSVWNGSIMQIRSSTGTYDLTAGGYSKDGDATNWNGTLDTDIGLTVGDLVIIGGATNGDLSAHSAQAIAATGISSISTVREHGEFPSTTGNDIEQTISTGMIWAGTNSTTPTITYTQSVASSGVVYAVRVRQGSGTNRTDTFVRSSSAQVAGTTSVIVPYPDHEIGDRLIMFVGNRYDTATPSTPANWTLIANNYTGGAGANGADAGTARISAYYRDVTSLLTGTQTVTVTSGNTAIGQIFAIHKDDIDTWTMDSDGGADSSAGTGWSATGSGIDLDSADGGDIVLVGSSINTDIYTYTAHAMSASGITFGDVTQSSEFRSATGNDMTLMAATARVSGGSASNVAPTFTATASGSTASAPAGASIFIKILGTAPTTTLADGTDGSNSTIAPGASATEIDRFSLVTSTGTDTVTGLTVTLAPAGAFNNLATVGVYTTGDVLKCSSSSWGGDLTVELTSCAISVTTTPTDYVVKITPLSHANMPAVPGASYATTATVTAITATNSTAGTDTDSATITVDNASPGGVTSSTATAGNTVVDLAWTNPADSDFTTSGTVVVLRRATSAVADVPVEGTTYTVGNTIGTATVACVVTGSPPTTTCQDTSLTNGTVYHYKIFTQDSRGNYDAGVVPTGSPATPVAPVEISGVIYTNDAASTPFDCSAVNVTVRVAVNGVLSGTPVACTLNTGVYSITTPTYAAGNVLTVFVDTGTSANQGAVITRAASASAISGLQVITGRVTVRNEDGTAVTNTNLGLYDADNNANIPFTSNAGVFSVAAGKKLLVWAGKTFAPGGTVTTAPASTAGNIDGDILIQTSATLSMGTNALSVGGDFTNSGTFSYDTQTTTFTATGTGFTIEDGTSNFNSIAFNGSGGAWTPQSDLTVGGTTTITAGNLTLSANAFAATGATSITGTLTISSATGAKSFTGDVTVNASGTWNNSGNTDVALAGNLANNQTFTAGSGVYTMSGATKTITGTVAIPSLAITGTVSNTNTLTVATALSGAGTLTNSATGTLNIGGTSGITTLTASASGNTVNYTASTPTCKVTTYHTLNFSGTGAVTCAVTTVNDITMSSTASWTTTSSVNAVASLTVGASNTFINGSFTLTAPTLTVYTANFTNNGTATVATSLAGSGTFTNGAAGTLNIGFATAPSITTLTASASGNIVNYTGAGQTCKATLYGTLNFTGSGSVTCATTNVAGVLSTSGTVSLTTGDNLAIGGAITVGNGTTFTQGGAYTLQVDGTTTIGGGTSGSFVGSASSLTLKGNLTLNSGSTWTKGAGTVTFNKGAAQTITDNTALKQDLGAVVTSTGSTNVSTATDIKLTSLNIGNSTTWNITDDTMTLTGTATPLSVTGTFTTTNSTVDFTGNGATITATDYNNLGLKPSSSSAQILGAGFFSIVGSLTVGDGSNAGATALLNSPFLDIGGILTISAGAVFTAGNNDIILTNTTTPFVVNGTFAPILSGVTFYGNGATVTATNYYNLTTAPPSSGSQTLGPGSFDIAGNWYVGQGTPGNKTISGSVNNPTINVTGDLNIQSNEELISSSGNLTVGGNFENYGLFTHNSGTVKFTGASKTASGNMIGTSAFKNVELVSGGRNFSNNASTTNLTITSGTLTAPSLLSIAGNYSNSGTFTHNNGTTTFNGITNQALSGSMIGTSAFRNLEILNNTLTATTTFANNASTTANFYVPLSNARIAFPANATSTFTNFIINGISTGNEARLWSSTPGSWWGLDVPGINSVTYASVADSRACSGNPDITAGATVINRGGNTCWGFGANSNPTISSAQNQSFSFGQSATTISTITVTEDATPVLTAGNNLRIAIATTSVNMLWDTTDTTATFGGTASGKVSSTVSYEGGGSVLVIDVTESFAGNDILTISGLSFANFGAVNSAISALDLYKDGASDIISDADDDKTIAIKGNLVLAPHVSGYESNKFEIITDSVTNAELYSFKLTPTGENMLVTNLQLVLTGVRGFNANDFINNKIIIDYDADGSIDVGEDEVGGAGIVSLIQSTEGTITFAGDFTATTTRNYIYKADVSNINPLDAINVRLRPENITASGVTSTQTITSTGTTFTHTNHIRIPSTAGDDAPTGAGIVSGGGSSGGEIIGGESGFNYPSTTGNPLGQWLNSANAYDQIDGTYATETTVGEVQDFGTFAFSVPSGNIIDGIQVKIEASGSSAAGTIDAALSWNTGSNFTSVKSTATLSTTDTVYTLGGTGDNWGRVWSSNEFTNGNFRLRITGQPNNNTVKIDAIQIKVFHHTGGGGSGGGGEI